MHAEHNIFYGNKLSSHLSQMLSQVFNNCHEVLPLWHSETYIQVSKPLMPHHAQLLLMILGYCTFDNHVN